MAILFLELEDEITSAVARLRAASDPAVAIVLPAGSRIASSRINFRLLAREAESLGTQLAIVSPETTARALASAAGLPTFGSVNRYETAMSGGALAAGEAPGDGAADTAGPPSGTDRDATLPPFAPGSPYASGGYPGSDAGPGAGVAAAGEAAPRRLPVAHGPRRLVLPRFGGGAVIAAIVLLALLGAGTVAAAYFLLPEARITVTPRIEALDPLVLDVTADPAATASDPANGIVPAAWLDTTVDAQDTFKATGAKVVETKATGSVRFSWSGTNYACAVPAGTAVRTNKGTAFKTAKSVTVPIATVAGNIVTPGTASVAVEANVAGTAGNVAANTITRIMTFPPGCSPHSLLKVTNPNPTTGGMHTETKVVRQSDYDAAVAALKKQLGKSFADWLASGPEGTAIRIDETATLEAPTFDTAAGDVVGKAMDAFDLAAHAAGRVLTVDPALLDAAGAARFRSGQVPAGYALVEASVAAQHQQVDSTDPAKPRFELTVSGKGYRQLDAAALERLVLGKPVAEARATLSTYGDTVVTLTPDWFGTIPQLDWRVSVQVLPPTGAS